MKNYQYKHTVFIFVLSSSDGDLPFNNVCHKKSNICRVNEISRIKLSKKICQIMLLLKF